LQKNYRRNSEQPKGNAAENLAEIAKKNIAPA
jgi:hypothetical protein